MAGAPTTEQTASSHDDSATTKRSQFPAGVVPAAAVLLAVAAGLLSLLPSLAQAVWEVPHLFVLGLVISYGVFTQRNTDLEQAGGDGNNNVILAWNNARHHRPDEPLIVVAADHAHEGAMERPLSLPVRRLKPPPPTQETDATGDASSDGGVGEETEISSASSSGFCAGARTAPSPPSVLDADLGLSPCSSQPQSPPFFAHKPGGGFSSGYDHPYMARDETFSEDDGEATDWDDDDEVDAADEMTVSSERSSARGDFVTACANDHNDGDGEGKDEVDRKADEFIAKFRERIRMQKF
ncbi:hypothetical protein PR202_gb09252 [Eleusine coracana subsp. coracana]|uniref:Uncharacterized protein n=1 Tax=Eleusine coracana subsp. coracana TaxID=191504 RepID=A0AAV5EGG3_ELECO|nr:hypothetical protein PR202_gb09252 [Eleusine coracana subsp. coracana]